LELSRLSLVRFGASFLLLFTTGILNRILIVDIKMAAWLVAVVLSCQHLASPFALAIGHLSDRHPLRGRRRTSYIRLWTLIAASMVPLMPFLANRMGQSPMWLILGTTVFGLFGFGLKAANLLVGALIADRTPDPESRGRQLNVIWITAILGFVLAGVIFSDQLPVYDAANVYDLQKLQRLCWIIAVIAVVMAWLGTWNLEPFAVDLKTPSGPLRLRQSLSEVLSVPHLKKIIGFLVLADFSFFVQEFVLEAFGGEVFDMPVAVTTSFNIIFGVGMIVAMLVGGALAVLLGRSPVRSMLAAGCGLGSLSFLVLAFSAVSNQAIALLVSVFVLGVAKGLYNVGLAHLFMGMATSRNAGVLMGVWGAFGGFAVALGALSGGVLRDLAFSVVGEPSLSYGLVFGVEVLGMVGALVLLFKALPSDTSSNTSVENQLNL
jgi:BCD family chlorophyll transporter-like MFS transporter